MVARASESLSEKKILSEIQKPLSENLSEKDRAPKTPNPKTQKKKHHVTSSAKIFGGNLGEELGVTARNFRRRCNMMLLLLLDLG